MQNKFGGRCVHCGADVEINELECHTCEYIREEIESEMVLEDVDEWFVGVYR